MCYLLLLFGFGRERSMEKGWMMVSAWEPQLLSFAFLIGNKN
jgi:hypothetical protein